MTIDLQKCLDNREGFLVTGNHDELAELVFSDESDEYAFVGARGFFDTGKKRSLIPDGYILRGAFELGDILSGTSLFLMLYVFARPGFGECRFSTLKLKKPLVAKARGSRKADGLCKIPVDRFSDDFLAYLRAVEDYANGGAPDCPSKCGAFFGMPPSELIEGRFTPAFYSPRNRKIRSTLASSKTVELSEVANILMPRKVTDAARNVLVLRPRNIRFPVDLDSLERGEATTVPLRKGDIVMCLIGEENHAIVFERDGEEPVYAGTSMAVIRANGVSPEYLCFYLSSDIAKQALSSLAGGVIMKRLALRDLSVFPVVEPSMDEQYYLTEYAILSGRAPRNYQDLEGLKGAEPSAAEEILNAEIADRIQAYNEEQLRSFLSSDIRELNTCFSHGAYKAAIILAGSILEAVLIDWISEIKHVNYFAEKYMVRDRKSGKMKPAALIDYINEIKYLERPRWMKEADMAHQIRKKRNLVHAKLCIAADEVNEETARMVIEYLDKVLRTRGAHCLG